MTILIITAFVFFLDQVSKFLVRKYIPEKTRLEIIKDKFYLTNVKNTGAAYGVLKNNYKALISLTYISFIALLIIARNSIKKDGGLKLAFSLVIGGGLGNFYDRLTKRYVTDFLFVKFKNAPIFNIADLAISIGNIIMISRSFKRKI